MFLSLIGSDERQVFKNALGERGGLTFGDVFAIDRAARFMVSEILAVAVHDPTKPTADFHRIIPHAHGRICAHLGKIQSVIVLRARQSDRRTLLFLTTWSGPSGASCLRSTFTKFRSSPRPPQALS